MFHCFLKEKSSSNTFASEFKPQNGETDSSSEADSLNLSHSKQFDCFIYSWGDTTLLLSVALNSKQAECSSVLPSRWSVLTPPECKYEGKWNHRFYEEKNVFHTNICVQRDFKVPRICWEVDGKLQLRHHYFSHGKHFAFSWSESQMTKQWIISYYQSGWGV